MRYYSASTNYLAIAVVFTFGNWLLAEASIALNWTEFDIEFGIDIDPDCVALGKSVAVSKDGRTILAGAPYSYGRRGAAYVLEESENGGYELQGVALTNSSVTGETEQGWAVALSDDGDIAAVGAPGASSNTGAVFAYIRSIDKTWSQLGDVLVPADRYPDGEARFGLSIAITSNGNTFVVGAPREQYGNGAGRVFVRNSDGFVQQGPFLRATGVTQAEQGGKVDISGNGQTIALCGLADTSYIGACWIFVRDVNDVWTQGSKLAAGGYDCCIQSGTSVKLTPDGSHIITGAVFANDRLGLATVWARQANGEYMQVGENIQGRTAPNQYYVGQGESVAISSDGKTVFVGGRGDNDFQGSIWVFRWSGAAWVQQGDKFHYQNPYDSNQQGASMALSADESTLVIGGFGVTVQGSTYNGLIGVYVPGVNIEPPPSLSPSFAPVTFQPSFAPTTKAPSASPITSVPSNSLTTSSPSTSPTTSPPSKSPITSLPSVSPSTSLPSASPTNTPSASPETTTAPSLSPPSVSPSISPNIPRSTSSPSRNPTIQIGVADGATSTRADPSTSASTEVVAGAFIAISAVLAGGFFIFLRVQKKRQAANIVQEGLGDV